MESICLSARRPIGRHRCLLILCLCDGCELICTKVMERVLNVSMKPPHTQDVHSLQLDARGQPHNLPLTVNLHSRLHVLLICIGTFRHHLFLIVAPRKEVRRRCGGSCDGQRGRCCLGIDACQHDDDSIGYTVDCGKRKLRGIGAARCEVDWTKILCS